MEKVATTRSMEDSISFKEDKDDDLNSDINSEKGGFPMYNFLHCFPTNNKILYCMDLSAFESDVVCMNLSVFDIPEQSDVKCRILKWKQEREQERLIRILSNLEEQKTYHSLKKSLKDWKQKCLQESKVIPESVILKVINAIQAYIRLFVQVLFAFLVAILCSERNLKVSPRINLDIALSNKITLLCCCDVERNPGPTVETLRRLLPELVKTYWKVDSKREFTKIHKATKNPKKILGMYDYPPPNWDTDLWFGNPNKVPKIQNKSIMQNLFEMVFGLTKCMQKESRNFTKHQYLKITAVLTDEQSNQYNLNIQEIGNLLKKLMSYDDELVCKMMKEDCQTLCQKIIGYDKEDANITTKESQFQTMTRDADTKDSTLKDLIEKLQKLLTDEKEKVAKREKNRTGKKANAGGKGKGKKTVQRKIPEVCHGSGVDGDVCSDNGMIGDSSTNMDITGSNRDNNGKDDGTILYSAIPVAVSPNVTVCDDEVPGPSGITTYHQQRNITEVSYGSGVDNVMCSDNGMIGDSCNNMDCSTIPGETRSEVARRLSDVMEVIAADYSGEISNTAQTTHNSSDCSDIQWSSCVDHDPMVSGSNRDINGKDDDTIPYSAISVAVSPSVTVCDDEVSGLSGITTCNQPQSPAKKRKLTDHEYSPDEDDCEIDEGFNYFF